MVHPAALVSIIPLAPPVAKISIIAPPARASMGHQAAPPSITALAPPVETRMGSIIAAAVVVVIRYVIVIKIVLPLNLLL